MYSLRAEMNLIGVQFCPLAAAVLRRQHSIAVHEQAVEIVAIGVAELLTYFSNSIVRILQHKGRFLH